MEHEQVPAVREVTPTVVEPGGQRPLPLLPKRAPRLSPKKRSFCSAYQATFNLKKAVEQAGIDALPGVKSHNPLQIGQALLCQREVQAYMEWLASNRSPDYRPPVSRLRDEIMAIAGNDVTDLMEFGPVDEEGYRPLKRLRFDRIDGRAIAALKVINEMGKPQRVEVRFHPKVEALKLLAQEAGMLSDNAGELPQINIQINLGSR
ncbi:MAG: terminase small subunit [Patescibacteria group bacterium]|nr:terminase small subunit [Patescibacteria group bacterium]